MASGIDSELDKIQREGENALERCKKAKKDKSFNLSQDEILNKFWERFKIIRETDFKGSELDIVNDHARALTLITEARRTKFDLHELLEKTYSGQKFGRVKKERLEWVDEMTAGLDSLVKKLELRVERGDPSRSIYKTSKEEIPELHPLMETPLLLIEEHLDRKQFEEEVKILYEVAPHVRELHTLIYTLQQKRVDLAIMVLTFSDWIGNALDLCQKSTMWPKLGPSIGHILLAAFGGALAASWSMLRRLYGLDLSQKTKKLTQGKQLKRVIGTHNSWKLKEAEEKKKAEEEKKIAEEKKKLEESKTDEERKAEESVTSKSSNKEEILAAPATFSSPPNSPSLARQNTTSPWKKHLDPKTSQYFYYHTPTGKSQWTVPADYFEPSPTKLRSKKAPSLVSTMSPSSSPKNSVIHNRSVFKATTSSKSRSMKIG